MDWRRRGLLWNLHTTRNRTALCGRGQEKVAGQEQQRHTMMGHDTEEEVEEEDEDISWRLPATKLNRFMRLGLRTWGSPVTTMVT